MYPYTFVEIDDEKQDFIPIGLTNLGKYIYVNPILELLGGIKEFKDHFIKNGEDYTTKIEKNKSSLLSFVTNRLYKNFYYKEETKKKKLYNSKNFLKVLNELNKFLGSSENTKLNDVLMFILNQLHDENNNIQYKNSSFQKYNNRNLKEVINNGIKYFKENNNSIITSTLNFYLLQTLICPECNNQYFEIKTFPTFELNISYAYQKMMPSGNRIISLKDCLDNEKSSKDKSLKFYCDVCNSYRVSKEVNYQFYKINDKIIFLLDRGEGFDDDNFPLNIIFKIESIIDLNEYMLNPNLSSKFVLTGIISLESKEKRFVCFSKSFMNDKWYLYLDEYTEEKNCIEDILTEHNDKWKYIPYVLMYSKIN